MPICGRASSRPSFVTHARESADPSLSRAPLDQCRCVREEYIPLREIELGILASKRADIGIRPFAMQRVLQELNHHDPGRVLFWRGTYPLGKGFNFSMKPVLVVCTYISAAFRQRCHGTSTHHGVLRAAACSRTVSSTCTSSLVSDSWEEDSSTSSSDSDI